MKLPLADALRALGLTDRLDYHRAFAAIRRGRLPAEKRGPHVYVDRRELERYERERTNRGEPSGEDRVAAYEAVVFDLDARETELQRRIATADTQMIEAMKTKAAAQGELMALGSERSRKIEAEKKKLWTQAHALVDPTWRVIRTMRREWEKDAAGRQPGQLQKLQRARGEIERAVLGAKTDAEIADVVAKVRKDLRLV